MTEEVCPSCGGFCKSLVASTGFCLLCTRTYHPDLAPKYYNNLKAARLERWLTKFADDIEELMVEFNITARTALILISSEKKPHCLVCGEQIRNGTYGTHVLCNGTVQCRKARRRFRYLVYDKGLAKEKALQIVWEENHAGLASSIRPTA